MVWCSKRSAQSADRCHRANLPADVGVSGGRKAEEVRRVGEGTCVFVAKVEPHVSNNSTGHLLCITIIQCKFVQILLLDLFHKVG